VTGGRNTVRQSLFAAPGQQGMVKATDYNLVLLPRRGNKDKIEIAKNWADPHDSPHFK
jgi:hypothetical protein